MMAQVQYSFWILGLLSFDQWNHSGLKIWTGGLKSEFEGFGFILKPLFLLR
jgi:hypothetical protein